MIFSDANVSKVKTGDHVVLVRSVDDNSMHSISAHTEFCSKDNAYLVSIDKTEKAFDGKWFDGKTGNWAHIGDDQINQIADHMKNVHELKQSGSLGVNNGGLEAAGRFTWDNSAVKILENVRIF